MQIGFASADISPPLGTHKVGWLKDIVGDRLVDPLFARAIVLDDGNSPLALVQLDTLSIRWSSVEAIRARVEEETGIPAGNVLIGATHNHAGPAIADIGDVPRDPGYVAQLVDRVAGAIGEAFAARQEAELGFASCTEYRLSHNRRVVMRDGIVKTHGNPTVPEALFIEGPIDPEVAVLAARTPGGELLGALVNFTCHPTHHGGDTSFSAGWPGAMVTSLQKAGVPHAVFLQGCCANIAMGNRFVAVNADNHLAYGAVLADDVLNLLGGMEYSADWPLAAVRRSVDLPYREPTDEQVKGTVRGAQRFIDSAIYDRGMPRLVERIRERRVQPAEVQMLSVGSLRFISIPAEYFVEFGLRIKEEAYPLRALVVGYANGMVGYVPTRRAFVRGGYETTFAMSSRLAPEAGDMLCQTALDLLSEAQS